jgi:hypothetical protein
VLVGEMVSLVYTKLGESGAGYYTTAKIIGALNEAYRVGRHKVNKVDSEGEHLAEWSNDVSYTANTRWMSLSAWTGAFRGKPMKIFAVQSVTSGTVVTGRGIPVPIVTERQEYDYGNRYSDTFCVFGNAYAIGAPLGGAPYVGSIGLRCQGGTPSSAVKLRIKFSPPIYPMISAGNYPVFPGPALPATLAWDAWEPPFIPDFYEWICNYAAASLATSEDKPIGDLAAMADSFERELMDYVGQWRQNQDRPEIVISQEMEGMYDY